MRATPNDLKLTDAPVGQGGAQSAGGEENAHPNAGAQGRSVQRLVMRRSWLRRLYDWGGSLDWDRKHMTIGDVVFGFVAVYGTFVLVCLYLLWSRWP